LKDGGRRSLSPVVFSFEKATGFSEGEQAAVYLELIFSAVVGDGDDVADGVAAFAKELGDQVDVDVVLHGDTSGKLDAECKAEIRLESLMTGYCGSGAGEG
jgi:hypothetical protein